MTHGHHGHGAHGDAIEVTVAPLSAAMLRSPRVWLRAAAGERGAIASVLSSLGIDVMSLGFGDLLSSSAEIGLAVDALAARTPDALQRLAGGWPAPREARRLGVFRAALRAAARHLVPTLRIMRHDLKDALLVEEARALFGTSIVDVASFERLVTQPIASLDARMIDRTRRTTEDVTPASLEVAQPPHLRAIRHLGPTLDEECQRWLLHAVAREPADGPRFLALVELGLRVRQPEARASIRRTAAAALVPFVAGDVGAPELAQACLVITCPGYEAP